MKPLTLLSFLFAAPLKSFARPHHSTGFHNALQKREEPEVIVTTVHIPTQPTQQGVHVDLKFDNLDDKEIEVDFHIHISPQKVEHAPDTVPTSLHIDPPTPSETVTYDYYNPAPTVLYPGVHPDDNLYDRDNLRLNQTGHLYYEQPSTGNDVSFAVINIGHFKYPTVILDRTVYITSSTCSSNSITITFNDDDAYDLAAENWSTYGDGFIVIVFDPSCGDAYNNGERAYLLITSILADPGSKKIVLMYTHKTFEECVHEDEDIDIDVGNFNPGNEGSGGSGTVTISPTSTNPPTTGPTGTETTTGAQETPTSTPNPDEDPWYWDDRRDAQIGYVPVESIIDQLLPGIDDTPEEYMGGEDDLPELNPGKSGKKTAPTQATRRLARRHHLHEKRILGLLKKVVKKIVSVAKNPLPAVKSLVKAAVDVGASAANTLIAATKTAIEIVKDPLGPHTLSPLSATLQTSFGTSKNAETPWGSQTELYATEKNGAKFGVYCVDCSAYANIKLNSRLTFSLLKGVTEAKVLFNGKMGAGVGLGITGSYEGQWESGPKEIGAVPLSPLTIPAILNIGPRIALYAGSGFKVKAEGKMLGKLAIDWPAAQATVDLFNVKDGSSQDGWTPTITRTFTADGSIEVTGSFYVDLSLEVGVAVLRKWEKSVKLVDRPSLEITAATSVQVEGTDVQVGNEKCAGIDIGVKLGNRVFVDIVGIQSLTLFDKSLDAYGTCINIPGIGGGNGVKDTDSGEGKTEETGSVADEDGSGEPPVSKRIMKRHIKKAKDNFYKKRDAAEEGTVETNPQAAPETPPETISGTTTETATGVAAGTQPVATPSTTPETTTKTDDGFGYRIISSPDDGMSVVWADNGNLYALPDGEAEDVGQSYSEWLFFASENNVIYGDADGRLLHAYVDTMEQYEVSRLRLAWEDNMPATSVLVTLHEVDYDDADPNNFGIMMAQTSAGDWYYPIICTYKGYYTKLFLAKDPVKGAETLKREDLRETITGQEIEECGFFAFSSSI